MENKYDVEALPYLYFQNIHNAYSKLMNLKATSTITPIKAYWLSIKPHFPYVMLMFFLICLGYICTAIIPYTYKLITDNIIAGATEWNNISIPIYLLLVALILGEISFRTAHLIESILGPKIYTSVFIKYFYKLINKPTDYFENRLSGELGRRINQSADVINHFFSYFPWRFFQILTYFILAFILFSESHKYLFITFLGWFLLFIITSYPLIKKQLKASAKFADEQSKMSGNLVDILSNINLVHSFGTYKLEDKRHKLFCEKAKKAEQKERIMEVKNKLQQGISVILLTSTMAFSAINLYLLGEISTGDIVMVFTLIPLLSQLIWHMGDELVVAIRQYGSIANALQALSLEVHNIKVTNDTDNLINDVKQIRFENVTFHYTSNSKNIFTNFNLSIELEDKIGLVGTSGVGKSTLIKLLLKQYQPQQGSIYINEKDIVSYSVNSLRQQIAFVPQDTSLFHRSIFENIAYANTNASKEDVIKATKMANAHEFIESLPDGYDTLVGERGIKLSGGQRQRIAIARALTKSTPIVALDEASSALDSESEELIQSSLNTLMKGKTVIAIAHRLSTLRSMTRIIVLGNDGIIEDGSPEELLKNKQGTFSKLWEQQKNGFI